MKKTKINISELKKDNKLMLKDIGLMAEEIENLKKALSIQTSSLIQLYTNSRDMFFGPKEFILSQLNPAWEKISINLNGKDITKNVSKIIIDGSFFLND